MLQCHHTRVAAHRKLHNLILSRLTLPRHNRQWDSKIRPKIKFFPCERRTLVYSNDIAAKFAAR
jgi:hypothetical protein